MLNMLIEEGALERTERRVGCRPDRLADVSIPDSVHGVIAGRASTVSGLPRAMPLRPAAWWAVASGRPPSR